MSDIKEYQPDLFTLEDENGNEETFELIDVYKENDMTYYALIPQKSEEELDNEDENDYFVILRQDDNEVDGMLVSIEDDDELDRLAEIFIQRLYAEEDGDECYCDDENCDCH